MRRAEFSDHELLARYVKLGSEEAFSEVVDRYYDLVYSVCLRRLRDPFLAQDAAQAVFLALSRKAGDVLRKRTLEGWLLKAAAYAAFNTLRHERAQRRRVEGAAFREASASEGAGTLRRAEISSLLHDALSLLGEKERRAVFLRYFGNKSHREVGRRLGISADAARMRVKRALRKLRGFFRAACPAADFMEETEG